MSDIDMKIVDDTHKIAMGPRVERYLAVYEDAVEDKDNIEKTKRVFSDMKTQIQNFQHERMIHLIVTVTVVLVYFIVTALLMFSTSLGSIIIFTLIFLTLAVLLFFYINHYFFLEWSVQRMYNQYDILYDRLYNLNEL